jgi:uncharacterized membrane protein YdjX (TVP38/TMEM64 family)
MRATEDGDRSRDVRPDAWGGRRAAIALACGFLFTAAVLALLIFFDLHHQVLRLLRWLDAQGDAAPLLFILIMALVMVLLLPGMLFTTGAGFVFGVAKGSAVVVLGTTLGAVLAFLIARHLCGARAARWLRERDRLAALGGELAAQGWKVVLLTRLLPFFPFKLSNYAFGLTPVSLRGFLAGTFIGVIPWSVHNVYLGSIAAELGGMSLREDDRGVFGWSLYAAGFLVTVVAVVYFNQLARRALARRGATE